MHDFITDKDSFMASSEATFGYKLQNPRLPVQPFKSSVSKFDPERDYEVDLGPLGNFRQL